MRPRLADGRAAEQVVTASTANWTIVRPPRLIEGNGTKGYRIATGANPKLSWDLPFRDLAACLLDLNEDDSHPRSIVGLVSR